MLAIFSRIRKAVLDWCLSPKSSTIEQVWTSHAHYEVDIVDETTGKLKFIKQAAPTGLFVSTPTGYQRVKHIHETVPYDMWVLNLADGFTMRGADTHIVMLADGTQRFIKDAAAGELVMTIDGPKCVVSSYHQTDVPPHAMYDLELDDTNHVYYTDGILSHNSETSCAYLFWFAIFHEDKTILITSNKHKNAKDMISRIKYMYEKLPDFLKPGVTDDGWNVYNLMFETGSRIISDATSENTGRGGAFSILFCLAGQTTVAVLVDSIEQEISLANLFDMLSCTDADFARNTQDIKVNTPDGWTPFAGVLKTAAVDSVMTVTLSDGNQVVGTDNHIVYVGDAPVEIGKLEIGQQLDGGGKVVSVVLAEPCDVYDLIECASVDHKFLINGGIVTKNCDETAFVRRTIQAEFWASISPTLATGGKMFITSTPNGDSDLFATLWRGAVSGSNGFKPMTIKWSDVPGRDEAFKLKEIAKNGLLKWRQEYECITGDAVVTIQGPDGSVRKVTLYELNQIMIAAASE